MSTQPKTGVPTVQTTLPGDELRDGINGFGRVDTQLAKNGTLNTQTETLPAAQHPNTLNKPSEAHTSLPARSAQSINPRRFHLTRSTLPSFPQRSTGVITKRRKGFKKDVAVFVENKNTPKKSSKGSLGLIDTAARHRQSRSDAGTVVCEPNPEPDSQTPQKRPNVNATERQWRAEQWSRDHSSEHKASATCLNKTGTSIDTNPSLWDYNSLQLAEQLQELAHQETSTHSPPPTPAKHEHSTRLRTRPKVPEQRYAERHPEDSILSNTIDTMDLSSDDEDDSEYVYDTYIRQPSRPMVADADVYMENGDTESEGKVGFLVITGEDEADWQAFAEDDDSDKDWNSEEEDENGKRGY